MTQELGDKMKTHRGYTQNYLETLKVTIANMEAYLNGKTIEHYHHKQGEWKETPTPDWTFPNADTRIAPEREIKIGDSIEYIGDDHCMGSKGRVISGKFSFKDKTWILVDCKNLFFNPRMFELSKCKLIKE